MSTSRLAWSFRSRPNSAKPVLCADSSTDCSVSVAKAHLEMESTRKRRAVSTRGLTIDVHRAAGVHVDDLMRNILWLAWMAAAAADVPTTISWFGLRAEKVRFIAMPDGRAVKSLNSSLKMPLHPVAPHPQREENT